MKKIKINKAYGAFEYLVITALILAVSIFLLKQVQGKRNSSFSVFSVVTNKANNLFSNWGDSVNKEFSKKMTIQYLRDFNYGYEKEIKNSLFEYLNNDAIIKDRNGNIRNDFEIRNVSKINTSYLQFDIVLDSEIKREQIIFNNLCLAKDSDFSGESDGNFRYIGTLKCVEIPHVIKGVDITSYNRLFEGRDNLEVVASNNQNIKNVKFMFSDTFNNSADTNLSLKYLDLQSVENFEGMFSVSQIEKLDLSSFNTINATNMKSMFHTAQAIEIKGLENFNTKKVTDMSNMFYGSQATSLDLSNFNTSNVTNMNRMFYSSESTTLDLSSFDTSKVTDMSYMFFTGAYDGNITNIILGDFFDTSNVENMEYMFSGVKGVLPILNMNTSKVRNMQGMFSRTKSNSIVFGLKWDTSNVEDMSYMFDDSSATSLNLLSFNTSKVMDMRDMFKLSKVETLNLSNFNTSNVEDMSGMFNDSSATSLNLLSFNTSKVMDMTTMFRRSKVMSLDLSSFDFTSSTVSSIFRDAITTQVVVKDTTSRTKLNSSSNKPSHTIITIK